MNYACIKMIDASVLLYFSFGSSLLQSRSMEQAVPAVHLTFYHLAVVIRDMSDIYRYSDHSLLPSQPLYTQQHQQQLLSDWLFSTSTKGAEASAAVFSLIETAKSNKLNPYDYIEFILDYLPQQDLVEDPKKLDWFLPWSEEIKEEFEIKAD